VWSFFPEQIESRKCWIDHLDFFSLSSRFRQTLESVIFFQARENTSQSDNGRENISNVSNESAFITVLWSSSYSTRSSQRHSTCTGLQWGWSRQRNLSRKDWIGWMDRASTADLSWSIAWFWSTWSYLHDPHTDVALKELHFWVGAECDMVCTYQVCAALGSNLLCIPF
jgi:hypothetical protein